MSFNYRISSLSLAVLLACSGEAMAIGLGEIRSASHLGEGLQAEIPLLLNPGERLGDECFRLFKPEGDLPALKQVRFAVKGKSLILSSERPVVEPILQLGLQVSCGQDLRREYILMLSPPVRGAVLAPSAQPERQLVASSGRGGHLIQAGETPASIAAGLYPDSRAEQKRFVKALIQHNRHLGLHASRGSLQPLPEGGVLNIPELPPPSPPRPQAEPPLQREERLVPRLPAPAPVMAPVARGPAVEDRLVLSGNTGTADIPLRLAEGLEVIPSEVVSEELLLRRKLFRLEYRMLAFLENQAETAQLPPQERLKALEAVLGEATPKELVTAAPVVPEKQPQPTSSVQPGQPITAESKGGWWYWLLGALGVLGALGWREWRQRQARLDDELLDFPARSLREPQAEDDPFDEFSTPVPPPAARIFSVPQADPVESQVFAEIAAPEAPAVAPLGIQTEPVSDTSVDEAFNHNPVMELAEIMLSFGRIKGAAQALQEYIDQNPKEALQPWVKLLEVYRLAGMKDEFETLAKNLNENFNVELIHWSDVPKANEVGSASFVLELHPMEDHPATPSAPRAKSLEDMPHIMQAITEAWGTQACLDYIQTLLRDNRGGSRQGFPLVVVDELLFLSELLKAEISMAPLTPYIHAA